MSTYTHEEIQELLGAYALDAVEDAERDAIELHLRECPRCRAEVADHREVASLIGHGGAPAPDGVWDRIVGALDNVLRPILIRKGPNLPLLLIFAGVICGLVAFGIVGLFIGPVVLAIAYTLLNE